MDDENLWLMPGQKIQGVNLQDMVEITASSRDTQMAKKERLYLKGYFNSSVCATAWQNDII